MANVKTKTRVNSSKTVSKKVKGSGKIGKHKQSLSGINNVKAHSVMTTTNNSQINEKTKSSVCQLVKDKVKDTVLITDFKLKRKIHIVKDRFLNKNGHVKRKSKDNLRLCNDILKNELLICDNKDKPTNTSKKGEKGSANNNIVDKQKSNRIKVTDISPEKKKRKTTNNLRLCSVILKNELLICDNKETLTSTPKKSEESSLNNNNIIVDKQKSNGIKVIDISPEKKKRKTSNNLRLCSDILKNELLICDNKEKPLNTSKKSEESSLSNLNNNNIIVDKQKSNGVKITDISQEKKKNKAIKKCINQGSHAKKYIYYNRKPKKGLFQCDYCQKQFDTKASIRRHMYLHLHVKKFPCSQCKKVFRKQLYLSAHITRQHPDWDQHFMCNLCDKPFLLRENLIIHMATHTYTETMFKCIYCKEKFSEQIDLIQHEKQHLVSGLYDCIICEQSFDCRNKLSNHIKTHLKVKDFICQHCGKEFLRMNSMRRHVQISHAGIRIQCAICKKYLKGHLSEHMRTHEKQRPHKCPDCGQLFTQSTQLNVHRRAHTGARPYPCRICDKPFTHSNALMLHIRRHTGEKPFECAMCPMSFSQLPHMKAHMIKIHKKDNPYKCNKCEQFFKLKAQLDSHARVCKEGEKELSFEEQIEASVKVVEEEVVESPMSLSRMRFLLALLLTRIATKEKLQYLGFNKRLIDDLLVESLEAMGHIPCTDETMPPLKRLKMNIEKLLNGTVPKQQMEKLKREQKRTEDILELLTDEKK